MTRLVRQIKEVESIVYDGVQKLYIKGVGMSGEIPHSQLTEVRPHNKELFYCVDR
jgi:hypothetical protein